MVVTVFFAFTSWMLVSAHGASNATAAAGKALESGDATSWVFAPITAQFGGWAGDALPILLATSSSPASSPSTTPPTATCSRSAATACCRAG